MSKWLNFHYASIHGVYWMYFGILCGFSSVFLLAKDYSNSEIGTILAAGNVISVLGQPILADVADRGSKKTIFILLGALVTTNFLLTLGMLHREKSLMLSGMFAVAFGVLMIMQPFANALNRRFEETGVKIAFGICRSIGSLTFAITCYMLGFMVEAQGEDLLLRGGMIMLPILMGAVLWSYRTYKTGMELKSHEAPHPKAHSPAKNRPKQISWREFIEGHKMFLIVIFGTLWIWYANSIPNIFMAQITLSVGGTSEHTGKIFALLALSEIPTMVIFDKLYGRFSCNSMLKFASVAFVLWVGAIALATSVTGLYLAQILHFFCFPLFLPAMVRFIEDNMRDREQVRGQTLFTMMVSLASIIASLIGGILIDAIGARGATLTAVAFAVVGAVIIVFTVDKVSKDGTTI